MKASATSPRIFTPMSTSTFIFALERNCNLFVQLLLQDFVDTISQQKILNCKDNFNYEKFSGFCTAKMTVFGNLR